MNQKIAVVGAGYVGLVTGACFSYMGFDVSLIEQDKNKLSALKAHRIPFYEPRLEEIVEESVEHNNLHFYSSAEELHKEEKPLYYFIAVGTPPQPDGSCNLEYVHQAVESLVKTVDHKALIILKSTVPVGTASQMKELVKLHNKEGLICIINNPEFLREGSAVGDFFAPERIVVGGSSDWAIEQMKLLYRSFMHNGHSLFVTSHETAELSKISANLMLASRLSVINQISALSSKVGADIKQVESILRSDSRIGSKYLFSGVGYGGSCFPKDVRSFIHLCEKNGLDARVAEAVHSFNEEQKLFFIPQILKDFPDPPSTILTILGLSFKPRTDDVRDAPALSIVKELLEKGYNLRLYDPKGQSNFKEAIASYTDLAEKIHFAQDLKDAFEGAQAFVLSTEWHEFIRLTPERLKGLFKGTHIYDGKNVLAHERLKDAGYVYCGVGRS